jgi:hypothetical protein
LKKKKASASRSRSRARRSREIGRAPLPMTVAVFVSAYSSVDASMWMCGYRTLSIPIDSENGVGASTPMATTTTVRFKSTRPRVRGSRTRRARRDRGVAFGRGRPSRRETPPAAVGSRARGSVPLARM